MTDQGEVGIDIRLVANGAGEASFADGIQP
jgi:hypothetical protein